MVTSSKPPKHSGEAPLLAGGALAHQLESSACRVQLIAGVAAVPPRLLVGVLGQAGAGIDGDASLQRALLQGSQTQHSTAA